MQEIKQLSPGNFLLSLVVGFLIGGVGCVLITLAFIGIKIAGVL